MDEVLAGITPLQGAIIAVVIVVALVVIYLYFFRNLTPTNLNWIRNPIVEIQKRRAEREQRRKERHARRESRSKRAEDRKGEQAREEDKKDN